MAPQPNLKSMSLDQLSNLRSQVETILRAKVAEQQRELESRLSKLSHFNGSGRRHNRIKGTTVAPKYRNPDNPAETWAGRGLKPRWLTAALKKGKKVEDFSIEADAAGVPRKKTGMRGGKSAR
jgi:DNA-binding protein H-NS